MKRIVCLIALMAFSAPASARDLHFTFHGQRIHINTLRHCRSFSCIRSAIPGLGWRRDRDGGGDIDTPDPLSTPATVAAPPPVPAVTHSASPPEAAQVQPAVAPAPAPVQAGPASVQPRPLPPVIAQVPLAATRTPAPAAQPASAPAPSVGFEVTKAQPGPAVKPQAPIAETVNAIPLDGRAPTPVVQAPPVAPQASPKAAPQLARASDDSDDHPLDTPLGDWQTEGKNGLVHIEACGASLCGYVVNASTRQKGEIILVNMKPKFDVWSGNIYSRSSGNSYYGTITMKEPNTLRVEACALGKFFCSGNNWTRLEQDRSVRKHELLTSRLPSNRS